MTFYEALDTLYRHLPAHPVNEVRYANAVLRTAMLPDPEREWHPCKYEGYELIHDGTWVDGRWYEWLDKYNNREIARMKLDAFDHFFPNTKFIKEEDVIAFRETMYNYLKRKCEADGRTWDDTLVDPDL